MVKREKRLSGNNRHNLPGLFASCVPFFCSGVGLRIVLCIVTAHILD